MEEFDFDTILQRSILALRLQRKIEGGKKLNVWVYQFGRYGLFRGKWSWPFQRQIVVYIPKKKTWVMTTLADGSHPHTTTISTAPNWWRKLLGWKMSDNYYLIT